MRKYIVLFSLFVIVARGFFVLGTRHTENHILAADELIVFFGGHKVLTVDWQKLLKENSQSFPIVFWDSFPLEGREELISVAFVRHSQLNRKQAQKLLDSTPK